MNTNYIESMRDTIKKRKANWIGHILRRNCRLKYVIGGKIEGSIEMTGWRGRRRKQLLDVLKENKGYWKLKEEATDRSLWISCFGTGCGSVVRQNTEWCSGGRKPIIVFNYKQYKFQVHVQDCLTISNTHFRYMFKTVYL